MSIIVESISKSSLTILSIARYTSTPVITQIIRTEVKAPITSARYQPKLILRVGGRLATHSEKREIIKLAKSVRRCAASVAIAKLDERYPPVITFFYLKTK